MPSDRMQVSGNHFVEDWELEDDVPGAECGRWLNGSLGHYCALAGTEFCDFECPYSG